MGSSDFKWVVPALVITTGLITTSCTPKVEFEDAYIQITSPQIEPNRSIPLPKDETILTITGNVRNTNQHDSIVMDRLTLESVGLVEYTVKDLFENENRLFRGVLMRDLLALWQVTPEATTLEITALNDYQVDIPIEWLQDFPVLLALQQDGQYMTRDYRGPTMLIFPYEQFSEIPEFSTEFYWIWQIKTINAR